MTNSEDIDKEQSYWGLYCFVSHICANTYSFTVYNILNIMQNILRVKYFDMVSQGQENISSFILSFVVIG